MNKESKLLTQVKEKRLLSIPACLESANLHTILYIHTLTKYGSIVRDTIAIISLFTRLLYGVGMNPLYLILSEDS